MRHRRGAGLSASHLGKRPAQALELYEFEACPFCRRDDVKTTEYNAAHGRIVQVMERHPTHPLNNNVCHGSGRTLHRDGHHIVDQ